MVRIRGQAANTPTRNFFPYNIAADTYNVDRLDFARGANASLFGAGASAGTVNTVSKQALTTKTIQEVRLQYGSWNRYRMTVDYNQPINDKIAIRTNLLWQSNDTWRMREWERRRGGDIAMTYNISPKFSMRAEYEYRVTDKTTGTNRTKDNTSAWDGKFTPTGIDLTMTAAQMAVAGVTRSVRRFVVDPDNPGSAANTINRFVTRGAQYNATTPNYLDGQVIKSINLNVGGISMTEAWDNPNRFAATRRGSPFFVLPDKTFTPLWDKDYRFPSGWERGEDLAVYFTYKPFENFYAELSADHNLVHRWTEYPAAGGMYNMFVDINRNKPDGTTNPYFLQPYSENSPFSFYQDHKYNNVNLQTAYVKETKYGKLQFGVMTGIQALENRKREDFFLLPIQNGVIPGADFRSFFPSGQDQNLQSVYTRQYTALRGKLPSRHPDQVPMTITDPTLGTKATLTPRWYVLPNRPGNADDIAKKYRYIQVVANMSLFKNHLVLIGAARRDLTRLSDHLFVQSDDMPADWAGNNLIPRPAAPKDYWNLTYTPKDATGKAILGAIPAPQRPRQTINGVNVRLPQYVNDRFQDDYSTPDITSSTNTRSVGVVINLAYGFGLYANDSTTFDATNGSLNVNLNLLAPTSSHSYDAGIRWTMPGGKLNFSAGWFRAYQQGASVAVGTTFFANNNTIANSPVVGDLSDGGRNQRGLPVFPGFSVNSTQTNETIGYESELTANLTRNWRLILNWGKNTPMQKDVWPDVLPYVREHDAIYRQILADSGILINPSNNQAFINPAVNDPTKINVTKVEATVAAWNALQSTAIPTLELTSKTKSRQIANGAAGGPVFQANIATDYRFQTGWVKGLRAGLAINYRGRSVLGARTADTIVDPKNPNNSIPDPTNDANNYLYGGGYGKGTANFSYTYKLKESNGKYARLQPKTIQFDLAIDNLFDLSKPVIEYSTTNNSSANGLVMAPRNNDISQPAIWSIPGAYNWQAPRSYTLTAKMNF